MRRLDAEKRIAGLDGLRAVAIGLVLLHHAPILFPLPTLERAGAGGWAGVDLFFAISGRLITTLATGRPLGETWRRRAERILPLMLVYLLVVGAWEPAIVLGLGNWWLIGQEPAPKLEIILLWSLAVELQFYFAWPLLLRMGRRVAIGAAVAAMVAAPLARAAAPTEAVAAYATFCRMDALAAGALVALLPQVRRPWMGPVGLLGVLALCALGYSPFGEAPWLGTGLALCAGLAVAGEWTALDWLGGIGRRSYSAYIWHAAVARLVPAWAWLPALALVSALSAATLERVRLPRPPR